jgi:hypothetical protein
MSHVFQFFRPQLNTQDFWHASGAPLSYWLSPRIRIAASFSEMARSQLVAFLRRTAALLEVRALRVAPDVVHCNYDNAVLAARYRRRYGDRLAGVPCAQPASSRRANVCVYLRDPSFKSLLSPSRTPGSPIRRVNECLEKQRECYNPTRLILVKTSSTVRFQSPLPLVWRTNRRFIVRSTPFDICTCRRGAPAEIEDLLPTPKG